MITPATTRYSRVLLLALAIASCIPTISLSADQELAPAELNKGYVAPTEAASTSEENTEKDTWHIEDPEMPTWRKGIHWYFAANFGVSNGLLKLYSYFATKPFITQFYPENSPLTEEYTKSVRDILEKCKYNPDEFIIQGTTLPTGNIAAAAGENAILIDPAQVKGFDQGQVEFVVAHEVQHLKQKHLLKQGLVLLALPIVAHYGLKAWDTAVHQTIKYVKESLKLDEQNRSAKVLNKIDAVNHWISSWCITKGVVTVLGFNAYSRICEKQADISAVKLLENNSGAENLFKHMQEQFKTLRSAAPVNENFITAEGDNTFASTHPRPSERIAYVRNCMHGA